MRHNLECIAIPIVRTELKELYFLMRLWKRQFKKVPPSSAKDISIIVSVSSDYQEGLYGQIRSIMAECGIDAIFKVIEVQFDNIPEAEDIYVRAGEKMPTVMPLLGLKNGPNSQFFATMRRCARYNTTLLSETDLYPIVDDWLDRLCQEISRSEHFLILGSRYKGTHAIPHYFLQHVNGNACYATGHLGFRHGLLPLWESSLADICQNKDPTIAYDTWLSYVAWLNLFGKEEQHTIFSNEIYKYSYLSRDSVLFWNASLPNDQLSADEICALQAIGVAFLHGRIHEKNIARIMLPFERNSEPCCK